MKIQSLRASLLLVLAMAPFSVVAQQKIKVKGIPFNSTLEVATAQISHETISLVLQEIDKSDPKYQTDNCTDCEDGKSLILDVDFKQGFKFPIEEKDSVFVQFTNLEESLAEHKFVMGEIEEQENSRNKAEEARLKNNADRIKIQSQVISKKLQAGEISTDEAQKQLMALMEPQLNNLMNSQQMKNLEKLDEYANSKPIYSMNFYNDIELTNTLTYSGYIYIKTFTKTKFVAEYRGELIEECVEKRAATSIEEEQKCKSYPSKYLPDTGVLSEGVGNISIAVDILEFRDNRN